MAGNFMRADLIQALHERGIARKDIHSLVDDLLKGAFLSGKTVELRGFCTFEVRRRKGRARARNPKTGAIVSLVPAGSRPQA